MERFIPGWSNIQPFGHEEDQGRQLIEEGWRDFKTRMFAANISDQQIRNDEAVAQAVKYAARYVLLRYRYESGGVDQAIYETARDEYVGLLNSLFTVTSRVAIGTGTGGGGSRPAPPGLWRR
jgi:hypothetical protein